MRSGQDLFLELEEKMRLLEIALGELGKRGQQRADAERTYRQELAKYMLQKRAEGYPATMLSDICRGNKEIARLKFDRDVADVGYSAALEAINVYKLGIRVLSEQIDREWHRD